MPGTPGPRTGLTSILTGDGATAFRTVVNAIRDWLETNSPLISSGAAGSRPTSTPVNPGIIDRLYAATDTKVLSRDTGWDEILPPDASITPAKRTGGFKIGNFQSHATTGSKAFTGLGFRPKLLRFHAVLDTDLANGTGQIRECHGAADGVINQASFFAFDPNAAVNLSHQKSGSDCIYIKDRAAASVYAANLVSFDADGFTLNVSAADASYRVYWEAYA
jgi:hypothetical protein